MRSGAADPRSFAWMAWFMLAAVLLAFPLTYFGPLLSGSKPFVALRHIHGAAFFIWIGLYAWQSQLVVAGKTAKHKYIGLFAFALSGTILPLGV